MPRQLNSFIEISGEEKNRYLTGVHLALTTLASSIKRDEAGAYPRYVKEFAEEHDWNWHRLPQKHATPSQFEEAIDIIAREYNWFKDILDLPDPSRNRAYFDELRISTKSGLPVVLDHLLLETYKRDHQELLSKIPGYSDLAIQIQRTLLSSEGQDQTKSLVERAQKLALNRSFLEQLSNHDLLNAKLGAYARAPVAKKLVDLGAEQLYTLSFIRYRPAESMFEVYVADIWQDTNNPLINEVKSGDASKNKVEVDKSLVSALWGAIDNPAWYLLRHLDQRFSSIHPVHVSRLLVGPVESKYRTDTMEINQLAGVNEILNSDPDAILLRASHQYSFAPNHEFIDGEKRQIVEMADWSDEYVVSPKEFAKDLSRRVKGEAFHVISL